MMKTRIFIVLALILSMVALLPACVLPLRFTEVRGSGEVKTVTRPVSDFNAVELAGIGRLIITQGQENSLTITAEENLLDYIESKITGSNLYLGVKDQINLRPSQDIVFDLTVKDLRRLSTSGLGQVEIGELVTDRLGIIISGNGKVIINRLDAKNLSLETSGLGDINISGSVDSQEVRISGMGNYKAENLLSKRAEIQISGTGNALIWVTDNLDASISGAGKIEYYGQPTISSNISGAGSINTLGEK